MTKREEPEIKNNGAAGAAERAAASRELERALASSTPHADDFHAHLDKCRRCREQPFNLCDAGRRLLQRSFG